MATVESPLGLTEEQIDEMSLVEMVRKWRFAPTGTFIIGDPLSYHFQERMMRLKDENPYAWVQASKEVGW